MSSLFNILTQAENLNMDADRLIRYTIHGWFFIFSLIFHYWAIGGEFPCFVINLISKDSSAILSFLTTLASSPGLGFIIATIENRFIRFLFGPRLLFKIPTTDEECDWYFDALWRTLPNLRQEPSALKSDLSHYINTGRIKKLLLNCWPEYRRSFKKLHLLFNLVLRLKCPRELSEFVLRRWNIFWLHINIISAIVLGALLALFLQWYFNPLKDIIWRGFFLDIPIFIYICFAIWHLIEARKEAVDIEHKWLLSASSLSSSTKRRKTTKK